jgi:hypothetical protein
MTKIALKRARIASTEVCTVENNFKLRRGRSFPLEDVDYAAGGSEKRQAHVVIYFI